MYGCEGKNQRTYGRTELERIQACHRIRPFAIHCGEYLQPQYHALCRDSGEYMCGVRHHLGPVLRGGRYGGADGRAEGNVFRLEFPFKRPEGSSESVDSGHESLKNAAGNPKDVLVYPNHVLTNPEDIKQNHFLKGFREYINSFIAENLLGNGSLYVEKPD